MVWELPGLDNGYDDNIATWNEHFTTGGPNLRVEKRHNWVGDTLLQYTIGFENVGDTAVNDVWIVDTLPVETTFNGEWWEDWARPLEFVSNEEQLKWHLDGLSAGEAGEIGFEVDLDQPGMPMQFYTNTVEITLPADDANPVDNAYSDVAFSGGEVRRVEFWLNPNGDSRIWGEAVPESDVYVTTPHVPTFTVWADPACGGCWSIDNAGLIEPDDLVGVAADVPPPLDAGDHPVNITIPNLFTTDVDTMTDEVSGQIGGWATRAVEIHGNWADGYREVTSDIEGNYLAIYPDIPRGSNGHVRIVDAVSFAQVVYHRPFQALDLLLNVNYGEDWVKGAYEPGHTVWITVTQSDGITVKGTATLTTGPILGWEGESGFSTRQPGWNGDPPDIQPGDRVFGKVDNGHTSEARIGNIDFVVNYVGDLVTGNLYAAWLTEEVRLRCKILEPPGHSIDIQVDPAGGLIHCDFGAAGIDIKEAQSVAVMYWEPDLDRIINKYHWPRMVANTGPWSNGNRVVEGQYAGPDAEVQVTIYDGPDAIAETSATADSKGNFSTGDGLPEGILEPWRLIETDFGNGIIDEMIVYSMDGDANPDTDIVTINAVGTEVYFTVSLEYCDWTECDRIELGEIGPTGEVSIDLNSERGFDVQYGNNFTAFLGIDRGHLVSYAWALAAPELGIWKSNTSGHASPGGVYSYAVYYRNNGNGPAENMVIRDTLPTYTSYAGDTSGIVAEILPGNIVEWPMGTLEPGQEGMFTVTLAIAPEAPVGADIIGPNCIQVETSSPGDWEPGNDESCSGPLNVLHDEVELGIYKWASPYDPTPGQEFEYLVQWCNHRGAAAGPVEIIDTLPAGVSLVEWRPDFPDRQFWNQVSYNDGTLILQAPGLPGNSCGVVILRTLLDPGVPIGTALINIVSLEVADDVNPANNLYLDDRVKVGPPRYDLAIEKTFANGILTPGDYVVFAVDYFNRGNIASSVQIADTLPPGLDYTDGWWIGHSPYAGDSFPVPSVAGNVLTWDLPTLPVGAWNGFNLRFSIDPAASPAGTNCVNIVGNGIETTPGNNNHCADFEINFPGQNLRVEKAHEWHGAGQLGYTVRAWNIGNESIPDVQITDTLPEGTIWDGNQPELEGLENERLVDFIATSDSLTWVLDALHPGEGLGLRFNTELDPPLSPSSVYTNIVEISLPAGDVNPVDNFAEDVAHGSEALEMQFADTATTIGEGAGSVIINLLVTTFDGLASRWISSVEYQTVNGSAVSPADFNALAGIQTIPPGTPHGTLFPLLIAINDDAVDENNEQFSVEILSADGILIGANSAHEVTIVDDDTAGITLDPGSGLITSESGAFADLSLVLTSQPVAVVFVELESSDSSEAVVSPSMLEFSPNNWHSPQVVRVTGVDDPDDDGDVPYLIRILPTVSTDPLYIGLEAEVSGLNQDNDTAAIVCDGDEVVVENKIYHHEFICSAAVSITARSVRVMETADVTLQAQELRLGSDVAVKTGGVLLMMTQ